MNRLAGAVFAILAAATFAAFFVAQRLKHQPDIVHKFSQSPVFSPNDDGRFDQERISFKITKTDSVSVDIVNARGVPIRRLVSDRHLPAIHLLSLRWNGRTNSDAHAPDGAYRVRVILRGQDRAVILPRSFRLDTTPPRLRIRAGVADEPGPASISPGESVPIFVSAAGRHRVVTIYRTDVRPAVVVRRLKVPGGGSRARNITWSGRDFTGHLVGPGVYLAGLQARDAVGNRAELPALNPRTGLPLLRYGAHPGGRGGITISDLAVQPPLTPTVTHAKAQFFVAAHKRAYTWSVRRVGGSATPIEHGHGSDPQLEVTAPAGPSGVYLVTVHSHHTTMRSPFVVRSSIDVSGSPATPHGVLVVLPVITWQGLNPVDSDGHGEPVTLRGGVSVPLARTFSGLPIDFAGNEADALVQLDHHHHVYDITTDLALAQGTGPSLDAYRGVLLAGNEHWITDGLARQLTGFVRRGGRLASLGTNSLLRRVSISSSNRLTMPTGRPRTDIFGSRILTLVHKPVTLISLPDSSKVQLFGGTSGTFKGYRRYEPTKSLGAALSPASEAVDSATGLPVIVAAYYGRGLVIRTGLPDFSGSLVVSHQTATVFERIWTLLSR